MLHRCCTPLSAIFLSTCFALISFAQQVGGLDTPFNQATRPAHAKELPKVIRDAIPQARDCTMWRKARYREGHLYVIYDLRLELTTSGGMSYSTSYPVSYYTSTTNGLLAIDPGHSDHYALPIAFEQVNLPQPKIFGRQRARIDTADLPPASQMRETYPDFNVLDWRDWLQLGRLYAEGNSETEAFHAFQQAYMLAPRRYAKWKRKDYQQHLPWSHLEAAANWYRLLRKDLGNNYVWQYERYATEMLNFEESYARYLASLMAMAARLPLLKPEDCIEHPVPSAGHDTLLASPPLKYIVKLSADNPNKGHVRLYQPNGEGRLECGGLIHLKRIQTLRMVWDSWEKVPPILRADLQLAGVTMDTPIWCLENNRYLFYPLQPNAYGAVGLFASLPPMPYLALPLVDLQAMWGTKEYNR